MFLLSQKSLYRPRQIVSAGWIGGVDQEEFFEGICGVGHGKFKVGNAKLKVAVKSLKLDGVLDFKDYNQLELLRVFQAFRQGKL